MTTERLPHDVDTEYTEPKTGWLKRLPQEVRDFAGRFNVPMAEPPTGPQHFVDQARQGDLYLQRVDELPPADKLQRVQPNENGHYVLQHSETGHHHVVDAKPGIEMFETKGDAFAAYITTSTELFVKHMRSHDTHAPIVSDPGHFQVIRQREYIPKGWQRVQD